MKLAFPGGSVDASLFGTAPYVPGKHPTTKQYPCDCCEALTPINGSTLVGAPFLCVDCKVDPPPVAGRGRPPEPWELPYE